ncbi:MAG: hypothetical protein ACK41D_12635 [Rubricoccaceae bacterium]
MNVDRPLSGRASRRLVLFVVAAIAVLVAVAVIVISRGWADEDLQRRIEAREEAMRSRG